VELVLAGKVPDQITLLEGTETNRAGRYVEGIQVIVVVHVVGGGFGNAGAYYLFIAVAVAVAVVLGGIVIFVVVVVVIVGSILAVFGVWTEIDLDEFQFQFRFQFLRVRRRWRGNILGTDRAPVGRRNRFGGVVDPEDLEEGGCFVVGGSSSSSSSIVGRSSRSRSTATTVGRPSPCPLLFLRFVRISPSTVGEPSALGIIGISSTRNRASTVGGPSPATTTTTAAGRSVGVSPKGAAEGALSSAFWFLVDRLVGQCVNRLGGGVRFERLLLLCIIDIIIIIGCGGSGVVVVGGGGVGVVRIVRIVGVVDDSESTVPAGGRRGFHSKLFDLEFELGRWKTLLPQSDIPQIFLVSPDPLDLRIEGSLELPSLVRVAPGMGVAGWSIVVVVVVVVVVAITVISSVVVVAITITISSSSVVVATTIVIIGGTGSPPAAPPALFVVVVDHPVQHPVVEIVGDLADTAHTTLDQLHQPVLDEIPGGPAVDGAAANDGQAEVPQQDQRPGVPGDDVPHVLGKADGPDPLLVDVDGDAAVHGLDVAQIQVGVGVVVGDQHVLAVGMLSEIGGIKSVGSDNGTPKTVVGSVGIGIGIAGTGAAAASAAAAVSVLDDGVGGVVVHGRRKARIQVVRKGPPAGLAETRLDVEFSLFQVVQQFVGSPPVVESSAAVRQPSLRGCQESPSDRGRWVVVWHRGSLGGAGAFVVAGVHDHRFLVVVAVAFVVSPDPIRPQHPTGAIAVLVFESIAIIVHHNRSDRIVVEVCNGGLFAAVSVDVRALETVAVIVVAVGFILVIAILIGIDIDIATAVAIRKGISVAVQNAVGHAAIFFCVLLGLRQGIFLHDRNDLSGDGIDPYLVHGSRLANVLVKDGVHPTNRYCG